MKQFRESTIIFHCFAPRKDLIQSQEPVRQAVTEDPGGDAQQALMLETGSKGMRLKLETDV